MKTNRVISKAIVSTMTVPRFPTTSTSFVTPASHQLGQQSITDFHAIEFLSIPFSNVQCLTLHYKKSTNKNKNHFLILNSKVTKFFFIATFVSVSSSITIKGEKWDCTIWRIKLKFVLYHGVKGAEKKGKSREETVTRVPDEVNRDKRGASRSKNGIYLIIWFVFPYLSIGDVDAKINISKGSRSDFSHEPVLAPDDEFGLAHGCEHRRHVACCLFVLCLPRTKHCPFKIRTARTKSRSKFHYREHLWVLSVMNLSRAVPTRRVFCSGVENMSATRRNWWRKSLMAQRTPPTHRHFPLR